MEITNIEAIEIRDSRGKPTLRVTVTAGVYSGSFDVPSGASTGIHEAHELRDSDGKGVASAIAGLTEKITPELVGTSVFDQSGIDELLCKLDGTPNKTILGGNTLIGVSIACAKTAANAKGVEVYEYLRTLRTIAPSRSVPQLYMNLLNGGKHAHNGLAFQEYHIVPDTNDVTHAVRIGEQVQEQLRMILENEFSKESLILGDEGGYAPETHDTEVPLQLLSRAVAQAHIDVPVRFALDVASSSFYANGMYTVDGKDITPEEFAAIYDTLISKYNLLSIEDPFDEESFDDFKNLHEKYPDMLVVGDDITVTNVLRVDQAHEKNSINAMIIKPNQIGTLTETLATMERARGYGYELIVSHRSGETMDDFIADLAYAFGCFGLKSGSPVKEERRVKYTRLEHIAGV